MNDFKKRFFVFKKKYIKKASSVTYNPNCLFFTKRGTSYLYMHSKYYEKNMCTGWSTSFKEDMELFKEISYEEAVARMI